MTVSGDAESLMHYSAVRYHNCNHLAQNCEKLTKYNQISNHYTENRVKMSMLESFHWQ